MNETHDSTASTGSQYTVVLVAMICLYIFFVRGIFGWLYYAQNGEMLSRYRFAFEVPQTYVPHIVALLCVFGFITKQKWAWWLAVAATLFELVSYGQNIPNYLSLSARGLAGMFKLGFLLLFAALLIKTRKRDV